MLPHVVYTVRLCSSEESDFRLYTAEDMDPESGIDNIRLYASGNNLLTWAAYDYIDPESGSSPSWDTPPMRTYTFGLEVKF